MIPDPFGSFLIIFQSKTSISVFVQKNPQSISGIFFNHPLSPCSKIFNRTLIAFSGPSLRRIKIFVACTCRLSDNYPIIASSTDTP